MERAARRARIVIVGAGFGGLAAAHALRRVGAEIALIDRHNYHLFQPLLYQVATASLSPGDIAQPIRAVLRRQRNLTVLLDEVTGIDAARREVRLRGREAMPYDFLILATGARHSYFGHERWAPLARGIKTVDDATRVRSQILLAFERAEGMKPGPERDALLTFVIVGGGPTGAEMAGAIAELARDSIVHDFRDIDPHGARVILVEAGPRLFPALAPSLSVAATRSLQKLGVEVRCGAPVTDIQAGQVTVGEEKIPAETVIWAAGVRASAAAQWLGAEADGSGRVRVAADFSVPGQPDIFVIGDTATVTTEAGAALPCIAAAAKQAGQYAAAVIASRLEARPAPKPFVYRDYGTMATIGRHHAIVQIGRLRVSGSPAWFLWSFVHIYFLIGFRNRLGVALNWLWTYLTDQRSVRLITGSGRDDDVLTNFPQPAPPQTCSNRTKAEEMVGGTGIEPAPPKMSTAQKKPKR